MKAIVQDRYGSEDSLELAEVDRPSIGDDEVLVRVHAASVHVGDLMLMTGVPRFMRLATGLRRPKNRVPGTDVRRNGGCGNAPDRNSSRRYLLCALAAMVHARTD